MTNTCVFKNDNQREMNVIGWSEKQIQHWIESNFDVEWKDIKNIEDVTQFLTGEDESFFDGKFTDLR